MGPNGITAAALLLLLIIFLPAALAACRHHNNQLAIIVLNIIAVIGITAALVLSQWRNYPTIDQLLIVALAGHAVALVGPARRTFAHPHMQLALLLFKLLSSDQLKQKDRRP